MIRGRRAGGFQGTCTFCSTMAPGLSPNKTTNGARAVLESCCPSHPTRLNRSALHVVPDVDLAFDRDLVRISSCRNRRRFGREPFWPAPGFGKRTSRQKVVGGRSLLRFRSEQAQCALKRRHWRTHRASRWGLFLLPQKSKGQVTSLAKRGQRGTSLVSVPSSHRLVG